MRIKNSVRILNFLSVSPTSRPNVTQQFRTSERSWTSQASGSKIQRATRGFLEKASEKSVAIFVAVAVERKTTRRASRIREAM